MLSLRCRLPVASLAAALASLTVLIVAGGCAQWSALDTRDAAAAAAAEVPVGGDVVQALAYADGVAIARRTDDGGPLLVQRFRGAGAELVEDGAPVAAHQLLDVDDAGNLYVFPAETAPPGAVPTALSDAWAESVVAKVDRASGRVSKVVEARRGIWSFGVSPAGDAIWVTACGPTGIFRVEGDAAVVDEPTMDSPPTLWGTTPSVLSDAHTFWSVGSTTTTTPTTTTTTTTTTATTAADGGGGNRTLVRATPASVDALGPTALDFGAGLEHATLARCGDSVCGAFPSAVVLWDPQHDGRVRHTVALADVGLFEGERIAAASGNAHGVYVTLRDDEDGATRIEFVPVPAGR